MYSKTRKENVIKDPLLLIDTLVQSDEQLQTKGSLRPIGQAIKRNEASHTGCTGTKVARFLFVHCRNHFKSKNEYTSKDKGSFQTSISGISLVWFRSRFAGNSILVLFYYHKKPSAEFLKRTAANKSPPISLSLSLPVFHFGSSFFADASATFFPTWMKRMNLSENCKFSFQQYLHEGDDCFYGRLTSL